MSKIPNLEVNRPHKDGNLTTRDLRGKTNAELNAILLQLKITFERLQNHIESGSNLGYRFSPYQLQKNNPNPRFVRTEIARVLTILRERGAEVTA